jgi:hypothetical protein
MSTDRGAVMGSKATATFASSNGKQEVLTMRGNFFDTQADILDEAQGGMYLPPYLFSSPFEQQYSSKRNTMLKIIRSGSRPHRPQNP